MRDVFDRLETAGHNLCHIGGPIAGISTYYCEGCGALVQTMQGSLRLFHVATGSSSREDQCAHPEPMRPLQAKLDNFRGFNRLDNWRSG